MSSFWIMVLSSLPVWTIYLIRIGWQEGLPPFAEKKELVDPNAEPKWLEDAKKRFIAEEISQLEFEQILEDGLRGKLDNQVTAAMIAGTPGTQPKVDPQDHKDYGWGGKGCYCEHCARDRRPLAKSKPKLTESFGEMQQEHMRNIIKALSINGTIQAGKPSHPSVCVCKECTFAKANMSTHSKILKEYYCDFS